MEPGVFAPMEPGVFAPMEPGVFAPMEPGVLAPMEPGVLAPMEPGVFRPRARHRRRVARGVDRRSRRHPRTEWFGQDDAAATAVGRAGADVGPRDARRR